MSAWAVVVYVVGSQRERSDLIASGDRAIHVVGATTLTGIAVLLAGLLRHDFGMRYVAMYTNLNLPRPYLVSALWSGQRGSLLLAIVLLSLMTVGVVAAGRGSTRRLHASLLSVILLVALATLCVALDPLGGLDWVPIDGIGMSPALQSPAAVLFPPLLIGAYAMYAVAGTLALASIIIASIDRASVDSMTRWTIAAWSLNTIGLLAAMWWAYREPSHSRSWTIVPFETGAILPWLAATAFLMVVALGNRRGATPAWSIALVTGAMLVSGPAAALTTASVAQSARTAAASGLFLVACVAVAIAIGVVALLGGRRLTDVTAPVPERRTYALTVIGVGIVMIIASVGGHFFRTQSIVPLSVAKPAEMIDATGGRWAFVSQGLSSFNSLNRQVTALGIEVQRDDGPAGLLSAEIRQYLDVQGEPVFEPSREAAVRSSLREDVHVVLNEIAGDDSATLAVTITPLVAWLWIGGVLLVIGGSLAAWPASAGEPGA